MRATDYRPIQTVPHYSFSVCTPQNASVQTNPLRSERTDSGSFRQYRYTRIRYFIFLYLLHCLIIYLRKLKARLSNAAHFKIIGCSIKLKARGYNHVGCRYHLNHMREEILQLPQKCFRRNGNKTIKTSYLYFRNYQELLLLPTSLHRQIELKIITPNQQ